MGDLETAIAAANAWLPAARPIIKAYLTVDDVGFFSKDWLDADNAERAAKKAGDTAESARQASRKRNLHEARDICQKAQQDLFDMLEGIRDYYRCDYARSASMDADEAEWCVVEEFNEELERGMIGVDAAVRLVEEEL